ncbi:MAG: polyribonucleotide nucleotidyltransferase [bacterium]|nr:polyribonucleotide nucleotidyltransferase [bacterium]
MSKIITKSIEIGGRTLSLEVGRFAAKTDSAVLACYGDTVVLATVVSSLPRAGLDYFPLSVDYVERLYAGGRIKGSRFIKREGRPSDEAILFGRLIDRTIRPLFPKSYFNEVQVVITVLSVDLENNPEILAGVAVSAALAISSVPWEGPTGTVKIGFKDGAYLINPTNGDIDGSSLDLTVSATGERCLMLEAQSREVLEDEMLGAIKFAQGEIGKIIETINALVSEVGKKKQSVQVQKADPEVKREITRIVGDGMAELVKKMSLKEAGSAEYEELKATVAASLSEEKKKEVGFAFEEIMHEHIRTNVLDGKRPDGRKIDQIRDLSAEVGILPRTHGSAVFARGDTQVLTVTTLGNPSLGQLIESPEGEETKRFIHHYSMPPFSLGEVGRTGTPSRREIGHGALAEKALVPVVPSEETFPYTIRLVSEVMSSNGSTSMASVCGSSLSLMDAGVPISSPVAGLALGLVEEGDKFTVLSDIIGLEDHYGDMDFKVAGTKKGITAIQLDVKNRGLTEEILAQVLKRARMGRELILETMLGTLSAPREKLSKFAPRVVVLHIPMDKIGEVIGPGGRMIRKIIEETKAAVDIEDDGTVNISGIDEAGVQKAVDFIEGMTREAIPGEIYEGEVKRIVPFGAFVEIAPGKEGLVHVSQMAKGYVNDPSEFVTLGQKIQVRVIEIDEQKRLNLSMILDPVEAKEQESRPREERPRTFSNNSRFESQDRFKRPFRKPDPRRPRF